MKKILLATVASIAMIATASATDLETLKKKKKVAAPAPQTVYVEKQVAPAKPSNTLSVSYAEDTQPGFKVGDKKDDSYSISFTHKFDNGFTVGGLVNPVQYPDNKIKMNVEPQVGYVLPSFAGITLSGKVGVGERFTTPDNFPYYAVYGAADYKINDSLTWNAVQYRYRNAFDTANNYESHQLGTGLTYAINETWSVNGRVYRQWDKDFNNTNDGVSVGVAFKF